MDATLLEQIVNSASPWRSQDSPWRSQRLALPADRPLLLVILGPYAAAQAMLTLAAHLARRGPLQVLDGGNRFNAYIVARQLRRLMSVDSSPVPDLRQCLDRIRVARAFTCYQMASLIDQNSPGSSWQGQDEVGNMLSSTPTLVLDLLDTFYDESAPLVERRRLAERCLQRLRQPALAAPGPALAAPGPARPAPGPARPVPGPARPAPGLTQAASTGRPVVVISLRPPPPGQADPTGLQELVQSAADYVLIQERSAAGYKPRWHNQSGPWPGLPGGDEPGSGQHAQLKLF